MDTATQLTDQLKKQISSFFMFSDLDSRNIEKYVSGALKRSIFCFRHINNKYYDQFRPTHSGQYSAFLYFLSHEIFLNDGPNETSEKIYYLNKIMHSLDLFYEVALPSIFFWEHPLGSVLGRARYSDFFTVYQGCTVGGSFDDSGVIHYPEIGSGVTLFSNASILGKCIIGENSIVASHTYLINQDVPANSVVFGQGKNITIKPNKKEYAFFKRF